MSGPARPIVLVRPGAPSGTCIRIYQILGKDVTVLETVYLAHWLEFLVCYPGPEPKGVVGIGYEDTDHGTRAGS